MKRKTILILSTILLLLTACGPSAEELMATYAAGTEVAEITSQANIQQSIDATFTYEASLFTATPTATITPTVTPTPLPTATPTPIPVAEVIAESTIIREGPGTNYSMIQEAAQGSTFEIIGQNDEGTWLVTELSAGVYGWINIEDIQLNLPGLVFEFIETPVPPLSIVTISIVNNIGRGIRIEFIPPSVNPTRIANGSSAVISITPGQYQVSIYSGTVSICQVNLSIFSNLYVYGTNNNTICTFLP